ncbi:MAG: DUF4912 domain-containing protein, partial [Leptospiraceae bacterium]|nr:DUF4912 domain-containing protein [Leptospiraceae bacterium]
RDVVKILVKNPTEAYCFWSMSKITLDKIQKSLNSKLEEVALKLNVSYEKKGTSVEEVIDLPPFTNNWTLNFDASPKNLQVQLLVFNKRGEHLILLNSAIISLPEPRPSDIIDSDWTNSEWDTPSTETTTSEEPAKTSQNAEEKVEQVKKGGIIGGSSGFIGSSDNFIGSSGNLFKGNN